MKVELTRSQVDALISAGVEIEAGDSSHWKQPEFRALMNAISALKRAKDGWIEGSGRARRGGPDV